MIYTYANLKRTLLAVLVIDNELKIVKGAALCGILMHLLYCILLSGLCRNFCERLWQKGYVSPGEFRISSARCPITRDW